MHAFLKSQHPQLQKSSLLHREFPRAPNYQHPPIMVPHPAVVLNQVVCPPPPLPLVFPTPSTVTTTRHHHLQRQQKQQQSLVIQPPVLPVPEVMKPNYKAFPPRPLYGSRKDKVVFVMGATGTGKSRLAIEVASLFDAEIVNSDKMQVYKGLDVLTNKVSVDECKGIPHHLLGVLDDPDSDFTASDFRRHAMEAVEDILSVGRVPIIAGGSNSYIEALVDGDNRSFRSKYECCFLWVDVSELDVLDAFVSDRVDRMVEAGMVDEVRKLFDPENSDYSRGIRRAIGVPEMDRFLRAEAHGSRRAVLLLGMALEEIKANTCALIRRQRTKIERLGGLPGWRMHRIDATDVFHRRGGEAERVWKEKVARPGMDIVGRFLYSNHEDAEKGDDEDDGENNKKSWRKKKSMVAAVPTGAVVAVAGATC